MEEDAVERVRDRRAGRTPRLEVGPEHEVVDDQLRAPAEQVFERSAPLVGLEPVLLVDPDPGQLLPPPRQLVAPPCKLLLGLQQLEPRCTPFFTCSGLVLGHRLYPSFFNCINRSTLVVLIVGDTTNRMCGIRVEFKW